MIVQTRTAQLGLHTLHHHKTYKKNLNFPVPSHASSQRRYTKMMSGHKKLNVNLQSSYMECRENTCTNFKICVETDIKKFKEISKVAMAKNKLMPQKLHKHFSLKRHNLYFSQQLHDNLHRKHLENNSKRSVCTLLFITNSLQHWSRSIQRAVG